MDINGLIKLRPAFKDLIWGGTRLKSDFMLDAPYEHIAEAFMLSCCEGAVCTVNGGEFDGMPLNELYESYPNLFGENCLKYDKFPLLIKFIDTMDDTSIQVHPDDEYADKVCGDWGKTQLWHILDCDEGASLICGFSEDINIDEFRRRIEDDTLLSAVNTYEVGKGDTFCIESGTLHAIGRGILLAEVAQNSELSYRVYDYRRVDESGGERPLNIQQALDVTITAPPTIPPGAMGQRTKINGHFETLLGRCEYFSSTLWKIDGSTALSVGDASFVSLIMLDGTLNINNDEMFVRKGESIIICAGRREISFSGVGEFIATSVE